MAISHFTGKKSFSKFLYDIFIIHKVFNANLADIYLVGMFQSHQPSRKVWNTGVVQKYENTFVFIHFVNYLPCSWTLEVWKKYICPHIFYWKLYHKISEVTNKKWKKKNNSFEYLVSRSAENNLKFYHFYKCCLVLLHKFSFHIHL